MKCKEVMQKFHKLVPFPITPEKITAAGHDVTSYLRLISHGLAECEDFGESPLAQQVCKMVSELEKLVAAGG